MAGIKELTAPATEPISLDLVADYLRLDDDQLAADTTLLNVLIKGARRHAENVTGLCLAQRKFALYLDEFPQFPFVGSSYAPLFGAFPFYFGYGPATNYPTASPFRETDRFPFTIPLRHPPVVSVDKITYTAQDGTSDNELLPGQDFVVDLASEPARVSPLPGGRWPVGMVAINSVVVYYTAGYTATENQIIDEVLSPPIASPPEEPTEYIMNIGIPEDLMLAMLLLVSDAYQNREPSVAGAVGRVPQVDDILIANRVWDFSPTRG